MRTKTVVQNGLSYLRPEDLKLLDITCSALKGKPDFNEYVVRGIASGFCSYKNKRFVSSRHILHSEKVMQDMSSIMSSLAGKWEYEDLYQELACILIPIVNKAKEGPTRSYFINYSFRYAVVHFLKKEMKTIGHIDQELCQLSETAYASDWVRGECLDAFKSLSPLERQLVMQITEGVHTVSSAARMFGYTRQWTSILFNGAKHKIRGTQYDKRG